MGFKFYILRNQALLDFTVGEEEIVKEKMLKTAMNPARSCSGKIQGGFLLVVLTHADSGYHVHGLQS